ncbi:hypothetical protein SASPL_156866 [Salvia splendens]|uniref:t-SNARE coiled-coil homology domain-containing protein n=1 Tax=Salvia splendens TaxID=180675 RepID=A0A8X8YV73_SALSN|nr:hypothetical protein SASPL_156866 [Salvia splendens]
MSFLDVGIASKPTSAAKNPSESQAVAAALFQANTAVALLMPSEPPRTPPITPNRKVQDSKLAKDLQTTLQEFQKLQHLASERESKFSPVVPLPSSITISTPDDQYAESSFERENDDSFLMEQKRQEIRLLDNDVAFNEAVIEEREHGIEEIQGQVREVNEMFKDLAVLVNEQSRAVDDIEHGIEVSAVSTTQAKLQLSKASKSGNSKTSWVSGIYLYNSAFVT